MSKIVKSIATLSAIAGLGVSVLPLGTYAAEVGPNTGASSAEVDPVTIQTTVEDSISITVSEDTVVLGTDGKISAGQEPAKGNTNVHIATNHANGYTVSIIDKDADNNLNVADAGADATPITAITGSSLAKNTTGWGVSSTSTAEGVTDTIGATDANTFSAVPKSDATALTLAKKTAASAAAGDDITVTFGVAVGPEIKAGAYSDQVKITATTNGTGA